MPAPQDKIWFVCITDHHEGPYTFAEVEQRIRAGEVSQDTLAWKDGMADWASVREIPELNALFRIEDPKPAIPVAAPQATQFSTAERFAASQKAAAPAPAESAATPDNATEQGINFDLGDPHSAGHLDLESRTNPKLKQATSAPETAAGATVRPAAGAAARVEPSVSISLRTNSVVPSRAPAVNTPIGIDFDESATMWMVKDGEQIHGQLSYQAIRELVAQGSISANYLLWRAGWTDFQPDPYAESEPELESPPQPAVAKPQKPDRTTLTRTGVSKSGLTQKTIMGNLNVAGSASQTRTSLTRGARTGSMRPKMNPMASGVAEAAPAEFDESPETLPTQLKESKKIFGMDLGSIGSKITQGKSLVDNLKSLLKKKNTESSDDASDLDAADEVPMKSAKSGGGGRRSLKNLIVLATVTTVVSSGVGGYFLGVFDGLLGAIPALEDITPEEQESLRAAVKAPQSEGVKFALAKSKEDPFNPTIYVTTNADLGSTVHLVATGKVGTLVNKVTEEVKAEAKLEEVKLAKFGPLGEASKPMPAGFYNLKVYVAGKEDQALSKEIFIGQGPGPVYDRRMARYKESLQKQFDTEVAELRQIASTLVTLEKNIFDKMAQSPTGKAELAQTLWTSFANETNQVFDQLKAKLKQLGTPRPNEEIFYVYHIEMGQKLMEILTRMMSNHTNALRGKPPAEDPEERLEAVWIRTAFEQFQSRSATDKPLDVLVANIEKGKEWSFPKKSEISVPAAPALAPVPMAASAPSASQTAAPAVAPSTAVAPISAGQPAAAPQTPPLIPVPAPAPAAPAAPIPVQESPSLPPPAAAPPAAVPSVDQAPDGSASAPESPPTAGVSEPSPATTNAPAAAPAPAPAAAPVTEGPGKQAIPGLTEAELKALEGLR